MVESLAPVVPNGKAASDDDTSDDTTQLAKAAALLDLHRITLRWENINAQAAQAVHGLPGYRFARSAAGLEAENCITATAEPSPWHGLLVPTQWPTTARPVRRNHRCCLPVPGWGRHAARFLVSPGRGKALRRTLVLSACPGWSANEGLRGPD